MFSECLKKKIQNDNKNNSLHVILNYISNINKYKYEINADTAY